MKLEMHEQATVLLQKVLDIPDNQRLLFIHEMLHDSLDSKDIKKIQEAVRKVLALRDQIAIQLYDVGIKDPRQLKLSFDDIRPQDFE